MIFRDLGWTIPAPQSIAPSSGATAQSPFGIPIPQDWHNGSTWSNGLPPEATTAVALNSLTGPYEIVVQSWSGAAASLSIEGSPAATPVLRVIAGQALDISGDVRIGTAPGSAGTLDVAASRLTVGGDLLMAGDATPDANPQLGLRTGAELLVSGTARLLTGATLLMQNATASAESWRFDGGTIAGEGTISGAALTMSGGLIAPAGTLEFSGPFDWTGGRIDGEGTVRFSGTSVWLGAAKDVRRATLVQNGTTEMTGGGITLRDGAAFVQSGTLNATAAVITVNQGSALNQEGRFTLTRSSIVGTQNAFLNQNGRLELTESDIALGNGGSINVNGALTLLRSGIDLGQGTALNLEGTLTATDSIITIATGVTIHNDGLFELLGTSVLSGRGASFSNGGRTQFATTIAEFETSFVNSGRFSLSSGTLRIFRSRREHRFN